MIDHELYVGLCLAASSLILVNAEFSDEFIRIRVVRKNQNLYFKVFCQKDFDRLLCRLHARAVTIIVDYHLTRKPA